jgi:Ni,Fe-hydrogenase I cytochrome b subunit
MDSDLNTSKGCLWLNARKASWLISLRAFSNKAIYYHWIDVDVIAGILGLLGELLGVDLILVINNNCCCSGSIGLVVKLMVMARLRLVPALWGFVELISVLIRLFVILVSDSRSRLCFNL